MGEALANKCIQPLDKLFDSNIVEKWKNRSIGNSFESYRMNGHLWALPLDAATQVMAYQSERVDSPPSTWDEVREVSRKTGRVSLSLQGPHAILTALSINSALGNELGAETLFGACTEVIFDLMVDLYAHRPSGSEHLNPISMLECIKQSEGIDLCPLIFGYVNYAQRAASRAVNFVDAPQWQSGGLHGSVIGGTGLALSQKCQPNTELLDHFQWLLASNTQLEFITKHAGQPSGMEAWKNYDVNQTSNGFYKNTLKTMQNGIIRPRFNRYIAFQTEASDFLRTALADGISPKKIVDKLNIIYKNYLPKETTSVD
ncbi:MAG: ABC transporter substrate-binding protein [Hyphomicrobiales bacterium]|nr:ABC transporter substrate-binding protein [Hyphomicrobiales bacterium]